MFKKIFTPAEANRRLPLVKRIVGEIIEKGKRLRFLAQTVKTKEAFAQCPALEEEIEALMAELEELGCFYKDWNFEIGLVDFPAIIEEEQVLLCWKSDEPAVVWYHGFEDGFMGRRAIPKNLLVEMKDTQKE